MFPRLVVLAGFASILVAGLPNPSFLAPFAGAKEYAVQSGPTIVTASYWVAASAADVAAHHKNLLASAGFSVSVGAGGSISASAKGQAAVVRVQQSDLGTNVVTRYAAGGSAQAGAAMRQVRAAEAAAVASSSPGSLYAWPKFLVPPPGDEFPRAPEVTSNSRTGLRTLTIEFGSGEDLPTIIGFYEKLLARNGYAVCCTSMQTGTTMSGRKGFQSGHTEGSQNIAGGERRIVVKVGRSSLHSYFKVTLEVKFKPL